MHEWRLILDTSHDAYTNMATDEAVMSLNLKPTLRLYRWKPRAVSIGYFQSLDLEADVMKCCELGVDVVRRITGGGAVFHDREVTYSLVAPESVVDKDIIKSYQQVCGAVARGLSSLGLDAKFAGINDIIVHGRKISGSAQTRRKGVVLQHGTILLDTDVETMFTLLKVPAEKNRERMVADVKDRVTSLRRELGDITLSRLQDALRAGFMQQFGIRFTSGQLFPEELQLAAVLRERFKSSGWNHMR